jgi:hypothetical protein
VRVCVNRLSGYFLLFFICSIWWCFLPAVGQQLQAGVSTTVLDQSLAFNRPPWIPLSAYTNDNMIAPYGNSLPWLRFGQPIPAYGADMLMGKDVSCYWRRGRYGICPIHVSPIYGNPGNFTFYTVNDAYGPHGWLQDTGQVQDRRRIYRYWFDQ